jgi:GTP-binding protein YchF
MSLQIGIVGLPNVGKSTLFKAITKKQVDAANYPFCTIEPNVGVVAVPDERLDKLAVMSNSAKTIYTTIEFVDIAGLVKGAHKGEGLGNKFLANIREVDAIAHVLREFSDPNVIHVDGKVDAKSDEETINLELIFADMQTLEKRMSANQKELNANKKEAKTLQPILQKLKDGFANGKMAIEIITDPEEKLLIADMHLLTTKPVIYIYNVDEDKVGDIQSSLPNNAVAISAKIEAELAELAPEEAKAYIEDLGWDSSGLNRLIKKAYETLGLITFLTTGVQESRAWTIENGTKAPQAAGVIHTDFEKNFIKADVIQWDKLLEAGGEVAAKEKGWIKSEGKEYIMQDGDVCHFRVGV